MDRDLPSSGSLHRTSGLLLAAGRGAYVGSREDPWSIRCHCRSPVSKGLRPLGGRASTDRPDPLDTPCHACVPRASPGPGRRLWAPSEAHRQGWPVGVLKELPKDILQGQRPMGALLGARTELAAGPRARAFPGRRHVNTCTRAGLGRVRGRADRVCPTAPRL